MALVLLVASLALSPASSGHAFSVAPREKIVVTLPSNASTGYRWRLAARPDTQVLKLVSHRYVAPKASRPGAAGKEVWRFRAVKAGVARLRLVYVQAGRAKHVGRRFGVKLLVR